MPSGWASSPLHDTQMNGHCRSGWCRRRRSRTRSRTNITVVQLPGRPAKRRLRVGFALQAVANPGAHRFAGARGEGKLALRPPHLPRRMGGVRRADRVHVSPPAARHPGDARPHAGAALSMDGGMAVAAPRRRAHFLRADHAAYRLAVAGASREVALSS